MKKKSLCFLIFLLPTFLYAQGCLVGNQPKRQQYVCFDGRSLGPSAVGYVWQAKRGCFLSKVPCCAYEATHYTFSRDPGYLYKSYQRCRLDYPFHLGEMQTH